MMSCYEWGFHYIACAIAALLASISSGIVSPSEQCAGHSNAEVLTALSLVLCCGARAVDNAGPLLGTVDTLVRCAGHSNAGVLAALSLTGASLMWPSLIALPYEVLVLYRILSWAQQKRSSQGAPIRVLQAYTGGPPAFPE